ncbi:MAG: hypothetical protein Q8O49_00285 [bacterium]|nr:hypothetical protein [bacterium]
MSFLAVAILFSIIFFIQQFNWLNLGGINLNLILIFFQIIAISGFFSWPAKLLIGAIISLIALLLNVFLLKGILIIFGIFCFSLVVKNFLTGNHFADFVIIFTVGEIIFYFLSNLGQWSILPWTSIVLEWFYSLIFGLLLVFLINGQQKN